MEHKLDNAQISDIILAYKKALTKRSDWDNIWQECYTFSHPKYIANGTIVKKKVFDGTAPDAVDELAGVIAGELAPRSMKWALVKPVGDSDIEKEICELATDSLSEAINASNFSVELHQCIVDLIVAGTAVMLVEPANVINKSSLKFTALDLNSVVLEDSGTGSLDTVYRTHEYSESIFANMYPHAICHVDSNKEKTYTVLEVIKPSGGVYEYTAILNKGSDESVLLKKVTYNTAPFIAFRWQKASGEVYGCSPIMKSLPDIKTANKVVELTLKNASISVTGIWQADDDGVLNPSTIRLVPGTIIPKAVGSSGLQPLKSPGDFNMSNMVLERLQQRIRRALLADVFSTSVARTATEVSENSMRSRQVLNAVYERIVQEGLTPMLHRIYDIMGQKGLVPDMQELDFKLDVHSPIERINDATRLMTMKQFFDSAQAFPQHLNEAVDITESIKWLATQSGLPQSFIKSSDIQNIENNILFKGGL